MDTILYLAHRIPYPPDKGDKIRSFHWLRHLSKRFRVFLGAFVDDPDDWRHQEAVQALCADVCLRPLSPVGKAARSLYGALTGKALSVAIYADSVLLDWINGIVQRERPKAALLFSSAMAQYANAHTGVRWVADFVDVDSAKWHEYGRRRAWPASLLFARESRTLLAFEREAAARCRSVVFVTEQERRLFVSLAPEAAGRTVSIENGVDLDYFSPDHAYPNPYAGDEPVLVFTGAMDYWANVDAVEWFARDVLPAVRARTKASFWIVGARPTQRVRDLESIDGVHTTGRVPDTRPYLAHAAAAVAPLRVARGVQNKVLEAMAMAKPVVATAAAMDGITAGPEPSGFVATDAASFAERCIELIETGDGGMGAAARRLVSARYRWEERAAALEQLFAN